MVGEDGHVEGADLAGVLATVHTLRQTDDQLAPVLGLHNLPPDQTKYPQLGGAGTRWGLVMSPGLIEIFSDNSQTNK